MNEIINSYLALSEESLRLLMDIATEKTVEKDELLFHPDKPTKKIIFIKKGLLRSYKIIDGKDYTHHFYFENWFATDFFNNPTQKPNPACFKQINRPELKTE